MGEEARLGRAVEPDAIALSDTELREAASCVDLQQAKEKPDLAWTRYLRAMALIALRRWLKERRAEVTVGPELEPEAPERLLALNGRATQLLCCTPLNEEVEVPLAVWQQSETAPQLLLLAEVDEDNGLVRFPGVLAAAAFAQVRHSIRVEARDVAEIPVERFGGGLETLLRWMTLLKPSALSRLDLTNSASSSQDDLLSRLQAMLREVLAILPPQPSLKLAGVRGGLKNSKVRLITPRVTVDKQGRAEAIAVCSTPTIWSEIPLAEVQIWRNQALLRRPHGRNQEPIDGPIAWPLPPLQANDELTIRLRPYGAPGGCYSSLSLLAGNPDELQRNSELINNLASRAAESGMDNALMQDLDQPEIILELLAKAMPQIRDWTE